MRASQLFMPTLKEDPSDAEAISHKLSVRGGFVRQLAAGIYIFLPLGWRVIERVSRIIRDEMNAIGGLELSMPTMHPAELWQQTGRYYDIGPEMFRLKDRGDRDMVLAMTHEEVFTWLAGRELRSYRDLPQLWYQIQIKFRDEPRPKGGILRVREFLMKDSYSFDLDVDGLEVSYAKHIQAYDRIFSRCGLRFYRVESDPGMMGGLGAHEYMADSPAGEDRVALCDACGYAANVELARSVALPPEAAASGASEAAGTGFGTPGAAGTGPGTPEEVSTPDTHTIAEVTAFLGVPATSLIKSLLMMTDAGPVLAMVRGDQDLRERKLERAVGGAFRPAHPEEVQEITGAEVGFVGPVGLSGVRLLADLSLAPDGPGGRRAYITGANKDHTHLLGVRLGHDAQVEYVDLHEATAGEGCPECGGSLHVEQVIEVGNIFKLGTKYSEPLGVTVLDEAGAERPVVMGSYGIGPARIMATAIEQSHDERGIVWPKAIAPFDVHLVQVQAADETQSALAAELYAALTAEGWEVLWDDRDERAGVKFADAELLGCPVRVTVGKLAAQGRVEVQPRVSGERQEVEAAEAAALVAALWEAAR